jgi:hypothetical protein
MGWAAHAAALWAFAFAADDCNQAIAKAEA